MSEKPRLVCSVSRAKIHDDHGLSAFEAICSIKRHWRSEIATTQAWSQSTIDQYLEDHTYYNSDCDEYGSELIPWTAAPPSQIHVPRHLSWLDVDPTECDYDTWVYRLRNAVTPPRPPLLSLEQQLKRAVCGGLVGRCRWLVDQGADIRAVRDKCLVIGAAVNKREPVIQWLLDQGADVHYQSSECLERAVGFGRDWICRLLLAAGADPRVANGWCLSEAADQGHLSTCLLLIDHGADPRNFPHSLIVAAARGHETVCRMLVERGADPRASRSLCLSGPTRRGNLRLCRFFIRHGASYRDNDCLMDAIEKEDASMCRFILECGGARRDHENDCLAIAATLGLESICRLLLEHGADPCWKDSKCLRHARLFGHESIGRLLIQARRTIHSPPRR